MDVEIRLTNLENLVLSFIKNQGIADNYKIADINGCRHTDYLQANDIKINSSDISNNREGLTETFENTLLNSDDISICRGAIEELYELITESEVTN